MAAFEILIGLTVLVVGISAVVIGFRSGWFGEAGQDAREEKEELSQRDRRDRYSVPLRRRVNAWPLPLRVFAVFAALLAAAFAFMSYQLTRTGTGPTAYLTVETYVVLAGSATFILGVAVRAWSDGRVKQLTVMFEDEDGGGHVRKIPFMASETTVSGGSEILKACHQNRRFGLFWRYQLVGDRRELRGKGKLPEDRLEIEVPDHAIDHDDGVLVETSPEGDRVIEGPDEPDKTFSSPNNLSYERSQQMRRENNQLKIRNDAVEAENAELNRQMNRLYEKIADREHMEREDFKRDILELMQPFMGMQGPGGAAGGGQPAVEGGDEGGEGPGNGTGAAGNGGVQR